MHGQVGESVKITRHYIGINFLVGFVELTLELAATRVIAPYIGLTIYVWTSVIGVILASLAGGYLIGGQLADKRRKPLDVAYFLLSAALVVGLVNMWKDPYLNVLSNAQISLQLRAFLASLVLFAPPTILLGCISPYLARLSISSVETSGNRVSRVTAAGTIGSLFGTFFTGFYLFGWVGTRNILTILGFCLIATSLLVAPRSHTRYRWAMIAVAVVSLLAPSSLKISGVTHDIDTMYGRYMVIDYGPYRALQNTQGAWQSAIYSNGDNRAVMPYLQGFDDVSALPSKQKSYLIIGGGAFTLPRLLAQQHPRAQVSVVEIDKQLVPISERYFNFKPNPNIHLFTDDGRHFLNTNKLRYDMLYIDAFSNLTPPFQLLTEQSVAAQQTALTAGGVVAVNIYAAPEGAGAPFIASIAKTYRALFPSVKLFRLEPNIDPTSRQSLLLLASGRSLDSKISTLAARNGNFSMLAHSPLDYQLGEGKLFTDDFAPVEQMVAAQK